MGRTPFKCVQIVLLCTLLVSIFSPLNIVKAEDTVGFTWPSDDTKIYTSSEQTYEPIPNKDHIELAYIESTGTQYIDTGVVASNDNGFELTYMICDNQNDWAHLFGAAKAYSSKWHNGITYEYSNRSGGSTTWKSEIKICDGSSNSEQRVNHYGILKEEKYTVSYLNNVFTDFDGSTFTRAKNITPLYNYYLFGTNDDGTPSLGIKMKAFGLKMYEGDTLVRDFTPVIVIKNIDGSKNIDGTDISKNTICLYDRVNDKYYLNKGSDDFVAGPPVIMLGDGNKYGILDYIESTGTQYIDLGYKHNINTKVEIDLMLGAYTHNFPFIYGARTGSGTTDSFFLQHYHSANNVMIYGGNGQWWQTDGSTTARSVSPLKQLLTDQRATLKLELTKFTFDETVYNTGLTTVVTPEKNDYLLNCNTVESGEVYPVAAKLFNFKAYDGDTQIREMIPALRCSDNKLGLYDLKNNHFYTNEATSGNDFNYGVSTDFYSIKDSSPDTYKATSVGDYNSIIELTDLGKYFFSNDNLSHSWSIEKNKIIDPTHDVVIRKDNQEHTVLIDSTIYNQLGTDITSNVTIKYSNDNGSTYTLSSPPKYKNVGTYTVYYEISGEPDYYETLTSSKTIRIKNRSISIPKTGIE